LTEAVSVKAATSVAGGALANSTKIKREEEKIIEAKPTNPGNRGIKPGLRHISRIGRFG